MSNIVKFLLSIIHIQILITINTQSNPASNTKYARCKLTQNLNSGVTGEAIFTQVGNEKIKIDANIHNLIYSKHGFHIHEKYVNGSDCNSTGPHFNPDSNLHSSHESFTRHAGDLGNLIKQDNGNAEFSMIDNYLSLDSTSKYYIIGRSCVVHEAEDDLGLGNNEDSLKTGNAGKRIACGTIIESSTNMKTIRIAFTYIILSFLVFLW
jgi:Cu-Zn family superoxide dismutase